MTHVGEHSIAAPSLAGPLPRTRRVKKSWMRCRDDRWPAVAAALAALHAARRRSVRIVDADCGAGGLLLCAARYARALGFTAIEARGIDAAPALIGRARAAAAKMHDPAIGITFEIATLVDALHDEADFPADIVVWHGRMGANDDEARAVAGAGRELIADWGVAA